MGILIKNFLVLLVATSYLWRPYLQRVQVRNDRLPPPLRALAVLGGVFLYLFDAAAPASTVVRAVLQRMCPWLYGDYFCTNV